MSYRGHVERGVIVLDDPAALPDGTAVEVFELREPTLIATGRWTALIDAAGKNLVDAAAYQEGREFDRQNNILSKP